MELKIITILKKPCMGLPNSVITTKGRIKESL